MRGAEGAPAGRMLIMKRNLLGCGLVAGPLFIVASLTQAYARKGFDLARHPISLWSGIRMDLDTVRAGIRRQVT
jgi:hypothetical protein